MQPECNMSTVHVPTVAWIVEQYNMKARWLPLLKCRTVQLVGRKVAVAWTGFQNIIRM
jgi:hypothetical protein